MKRIQANITSEQYRKIKSLSRKRNLTVANLIREALGLPIVDPGTAPIERVFIDFDLPHGGLTELSRRTGYTLKQILYKRSSGVPENEVENICKVIEDIRRDYQKPKNPALFITEGYLGKPPRGMLAELARRLNRPYNTVRHWHKYGVPVEYRKEVSRVLGELGIDK